ncbi:hypothetical protein PHJA_002290700 [Phtheirospermum japonicum]|uniref:DUF659 domain-containing protein n=1 Tax=Phtheirospermum japonicum TaxID=374723 RepID=A0A830CLB3_9LAMI|nr:hypothetical protein PHJA_002290700 [Phtheirospermum japonicum]
MRNKSEDFKTLSKKRDRCAKTDPPNLDLTQTLGDIKRCKSKSSKNRSIESSSPATDDSSSSRETKKRIGRFFFESGLDFDAVNLPSFKRMMISEKSKRPTIPTCQELEGWIYEDIMKEAREYVDEVKNSWAESGCSVLLDGWTDEMGRDLVNVLVDCPKGTVYLRSSNISDCIGNMDTMLSFLDRVINEIGIDNVVQIVTYSGSGFMKDVGKKIMERYRPVFWTVSASCCVELILEKLKGVDSIKDTLERAKIVTRFVSGRPIGLKLLGDQIDGRDQTWPFLILENIVLAKDELRKMSDLASTKEGEKVAALIEDRSFWSEASATLQAAIPLVRVIEWMDKTDKEQIGYIYETIDQVKETIKKGFKNRKNQYMQFWKAIHEVWTETLYSPLHSAGYFLNPNLFYSTDVYIDPEVATGMLCCIVRTTTDPEAQNRITVQMEKYRIAAGAFGLGCAADQRYDVSPVAWWSEYGIECPELQRLAVRVLGQTCDGASKFRLKRSLAETLLTKGRNRAEQKRLADMVFLRYNMHLKNFASGKIADIITSNEIDLMDDNRIVDKAQTDASGNDDVAWAELDGGSTTEQGVIELDGPSFVYPKVEKGVIELDGPSCLDPKLETL